MLKWVGELIDRVFAVLCAFVFAQLPLFMQQYQQRLSGHVAELTLQIDKMTDAAGFTGKTLNQFIEKFMNDPDPDFSHQGQIMNYMVLRSKELTHSLNQLINSSIFAKPFVFVYNINADIAHKTYNNFSVGLPFNLEGLVYALVGVIFGFILFSSLRKLFKRTKNAFQRTKALPHNKD